MDLSVITINRNNASGLIKTIESVMSQTYHGFEYIIVDGASSDGSILAIERFSSNDVIVAREGVDNLHFSQEKWGNLLWLSEPDSGIYNAMNKAIELAEGEYLLFLNSGDFLVDQCSLSRVFCNKHNADLLCARCNVSEEGRVVWTSPLVPQQVTLGWLHWNGLMHQSTFIKRDLFKRVGLYDESFKWLADIQFWYKAILYFDATTEPVDVVLSDYNHEGTSSTTKHNEMFVKERMWPYSQPVLRHVMPDFREWKKDKKIVKEYGWIDEHSVLKSFLRWYRKCAEKKAHLSRRIKREEIR